jgi:hypothetical protein
MVDFTKAVVTICVELCPAVAVSTTGIPVKTGEAKSPLDLVLFELR